MQVLIEDFSLSGYIPIKPEMESILEISDGLFGSGQSFIFKNLPLFFIPVVFCFRFGVGIEFLLANNLGVFECVSANPVNSYTEVGQEKIVAKDFDFKLFNIDVEM